MAELSGGTKKRSKQPPFDALRERIRDKLWEHKIPIYKVSELLGRNQTYMQFYIYQGMPATLELEQRKIIADLVGMSQADLFKKPSKEENAAYKKRMELQYPGKVGSTVKTATKASTAVSETDSIEPEVSPEAEHKMPAVDPETSTTTVPVNKAKRATTKARSKTSKSTKSKSKSQKAATPEGADLVNTSSEEPESPISVKAHEELARDKPEQKGIIVVAPSEFESLMNENRQLPDTAKSLLTEGVDIPLHFDIYGDILRAGAKILANTTVSPSAGDLAILMSRKHTTGISIATIVRTGNSRNLAGFTATLIGQDNEQTYSSNEYELLTISSITL